MDYRHLAYQPNRLRNVLPSTKNIPQWQVELFDNINVYSRSATSTVLLFDPHGKLDVNALSDDPPASGYFTGIPIELFSPKRQEHARKVFRGNFLGMGSDKLCDEKIEAAAST